MSDIKLPELPEPLNDMHWSPVSYCSIGNGYTANQMNEHYIKGYNDALSAVQENVPEGWQPIETAPKDESILLYGKYWDEGDTLRPLIGNWNDTHGKWECWWPRCRFAVTVTHWMPLPSAPDSEGAKS